MVARNPSITLRRKAAALGHGTSPRWCVAAVNRGALPRCSAAAECAAVPCRGATYDAASQRDRKVSRNRGRMKDLILGCVTDQSFGIRESNIRRGCAVALIIEKSKLHKLLDANLIIFARRGTHGLIAGMLLEPSSSIPARLQHRSA
jgi:hypothetical protein